MHQNLIDVKSSILKLMNLDLSKQGDKALTTQNKNGILDSRAVEGPQE